MDFILLFCPFYTLLKGTNVAGGFLQEMARMMAGDFYPIPQLLHKKEKKVLCAWGKEDKLVPHKVNSEAFGGFP